MKALGILLMVAVTVIGGEADTAEDVENTPHVIQLESVVVTLIEQVEVPAQEAGVLASVLVREGQLVAKGDLLAQIDDTEAELQHKRARIELENVRKQAENRIQIRFSEKAYEVAAAELKRATDSLARYPKSVSETEIDRLRLTAEKAALAVEQSKIDFDLAQYAWQLSEADLELASLTVLRRKIFAPISGVVVEVNRRGGEWVESSEPVFRILRIDRLRVESFLNASDLRENLVDCPVVFQTKLPDKEAAEFAGKLTFVSPEISPVNGQTRVWAEIENTDLRLRPGLRGSLVIRPPQSPP